MIFFRLRLWQLALNRSLRRACLLSMSNNFCLSNLVFKFVSGYITENKIICTQGLANILAEGLSRNFAAGAEPSRSPGGLFAKLNLLQ